MDRLLPAILIVAFVVIVATLMLVGWRNRLRRQSALEHPLTVPAMLGPAALAVEGWYVATTPADEPLERIAVHGLGFRARATLAVHAEGLVLDARGSAPVYLPARDLRHVGRATWAIDRVVERDGLVLIGWMLGSTPVDTYLRLPERNDAARLELAVRDLISTPDTVEKAAS